MPSLPPELLLCIALHADRDSLRQLRLTSRFLSGVATQCLFQYTRVDPTNHSCHHLEAILEHPRLAKLLTKITFESIIWDYHIIDGENSDNEDLFFSSRFTRLFPRLPDLPRLRSVALRFPPECCVEAHLIDPLDPAAAHVDFRSAVLRDLIASLARRPPNQPLRELILWNLPNVNPTDPATIASIQTVLKHLRSFRLNITNAHSNYYPERDLNDAKPHVFFAALPSFWLAPAASTLQHLTLYSTNFYGFYPKLDLRGIHLPHLKTLCFGNYTFVHDSQLDWILSHHATLQELYLDDCPILYNVAIYQRDATYLDSSSLTPREGLRRRFCASYGSRWHHYFDAFREGLPRLRYFRYGSSWDWREAETTSFEREAEIRLWLPDRSYMVFWDGYEPSPYMEDMIFDDADGDVQRRLRERPTCLEEDRDALRRLYERNGQVEELERCDRIWGT